MTIAEIQTSDPVSAFRTTINEMLPIVNAAATWSSGTLAARPAANAVPPGRIYFTTDTYKLYQSDGTTWTLVSDPFFTGTLAARPAANAVPDGAQYLATDTRDLSVSDGTTWFSVTPGSVACFARSNSDQPSSVTSSTKVTVFGSADFGSAYFSSDRFTAPVSGIYDLRSEIVLDISSGGKSQCRFKKNGTTFLTNGSLLSDAGAGVQTHLLTLLAQLDAGDYIELFAAAASGSLDIYGTGGYESWFSAHMIHQLP